MLNLCLSDKDGYKFYAHFYWQNDINDINLD